VHNDREPADIWLTVDPTPSCHGDEWQQPNHARTHAHTHSHTYVRSIGNCYDAKSLASFVEISFNLAWLAVVFCVAAAADNTQQIPGIMHDRLSVGGLRELAAGQCRYREDIYCTSVDRRRLIGKDCFMTSSTRYRMLVAQCLYCTRADWQETAIKVNFVVFMQSPKYSFVRRWSAWGHQWSVRFYLSSNDTVYWFVYHLLYCHHCIRSYLFNHVYFGQSPDSRL